MENDPRWPIPLISYLIFDSSTTTLKTLNCLTLNWFIYSISNDSNNIILIERNWLFDRERSKYSDDVNNFHVSRTCFTSRTITTCYSSHVWTGAHGITVCINRNMNLNISIITSSMFRIYSSITTTTTTRWMPKTNNKVRLLKND